MKVTCAQAVCHLCRRERPVTAMGTTGDMWFCLDHPRCNYFARLRLHMSREEAEKLYREERRPRRPRIR